MLAALLTFAELTRHSELTAIAAAGVSKPRLAAAVLPVALLIAAVQFLIEDQAVPRAVAELRAWGIGDYDAPGDAGGRLLAAPRRRHPAHRRLRCREPARSAT